jgi:hypothetical protein
MIARYVIFLLTFAPAASNINFNAISTTISHKNILIAAPIRDEQIENGDGYFTKGELKTKNNNIRIQ